MRTVPTTHCGPCGGTHGRKDSGIAAHAGTAPVTVLLAFGVTVNVVVRPPAVTLASR